MVHLVDHQPDASEIDERMENLTVLPRTSALSIKPTIASAHQDFFAERLREQGLRIQEIDRKMAERNQLSQ
jgi:hypothetical protein